jgi:hypothetical protein
MRLNSDESKCSVDSLATWNWNKDRGFDKGLEMLCSVTASGS